MQRKTLCLSVLAVKILQVSLRKVFYYGEGHKFSLCSLASTLVFPGVNNSLFSLPASLIAYSILVTLSCLATCFKAW